jgi:lactate permease
MRFFLALLPILLIVYLMVGRRWGAMRAGAAGYLTSLIVAIGFFGAGPELLGYAQAKALLLAFDVLLIIWAAFFFYRVADEAGAIRTIGQALPHLTTDRGMQAIIIGWVFASFLQGVGGFGVPVAVTAPILISLGLNPVTAVVIPSIGHGWAVNFGSLGTSFQALLAATGLPAEMLAPAAAIFLGVACLVTGPLVAHAAGGWNAVWRLSIPVIAIGAIMAVVQYFVAVYGPWNIAAMCGALAGLLASIPLAYLFNHKRRDPATADRMSISDQQAILIAFSGYAILIIVILSAQFIPVLRTGLGRVVFQVPFPETVTSLGFVTLASLGRKISLFGHTGSLLLYASILSYIVYRLAGKYQPGAAQRIVNGTVQSVLSSSVSIVAMVSMAVIMDYSGMTDTLARGMAGGLSSLFPVVSPWIGALGAFMTGSNTNSNVVFGALQKQTAELLGFSVAIILAAQTSGGSLGSTAAPTKIVVGTSTAGMAGREGEVLRQMFGYTLFLIALMSFLTVFGILLTQ